MTPCVVVGGILFANGVMTPCVVVGGILFATDHLLWVEEFSISPISEFIHNTWLKINKNGSWHVFPGSSFVEKCRETVISTSCFIRWQGSIRMQPMFKTIQLPTSISHLASSLSNMN